MKLDDLLNKVRECDYLDGDVQEVATRLKLAAAALDELTKDAKARSRSGLPVRHGPLIRAQECLHKVMEGQKS